MPDLEHWDLWVRSPGVVIRSFIKSAGGRRITLIEWTRRYGFGQKTGIELKPEESPGLVADAGKQKNMQLPWTVGDTVNMSIGQGFCKLHHSTRDYVCRASQRWLPSSASLIKDNEAAKTWRKSLNLKPETIRVLRQGLRQVVGSGTGRAVNVPTIPQLVRVVLLKCLAANLMLGLVPMPSHKPEIVVVAFAEHAGGGGGSCCSMVLSYGGLLG